MPESANEAGFRTHRHSPRFDLLTDFIFGILFKLLVTLNVPSKIGTDLRPGFKLGGRRHGGVVRERGCDMVE